MIAYYKPPDQKTSLFLDELEKILLSLPVNSEIILCGDSNIDFLKPSSDRDQLYYIASSFNLECYTNHLITRQTSSSGSSIDQVISSLENISAKALTDSLSDHFPIQFKFLLNKQQSITKDFTPIRMMRKLRNNYSATISLVRDNQS